MRRLPKRNRACPGMGNDLGPVRRVAPLAGWFVLAAALFRVLDLSAGESTPPVQPASTNAAPSVEAAIAKGRQHPAYQVFASREKLPAIRAEPGTGLLCVGEKLQLDLSRPVQFTSAERELLAAEFRVPVPVIDRFERRYRSQTLPVEKFVGAMRDLVLDYRYLRNCWEAYRPVVSAEKTKLEALTALQAGDVETSWRMYLALARPAPPRGLRVVR